MNKGFKLFQDIIENTYDDEYNHVLENIDECLTITQDELDNEYDGNLELVPLELFNDCMFKRIIAMKEWLAKVDMCLKAVNKIRNL